MFKKQDFFLREITGHFSIQNNSGIRRFPLIYDTCTNLVRYLVEHDSLTEASELLSELIEVFNPQIRNEISILKLKIHSLEKDSILGVLDYDKLRSERSKIGLSILQLMELLA